MTELFSWVPLPPCSPPGHPFPIKSLALSAHVSPQTINFQVLDKSPVLGPGRGPLPATVSKAPEALSKCKQLQLNCSKAHQTNNTENTAYFCQKRTVWTYLCNTIVPSYIDFFFIKLLCACDSKSSRAAPNEISCLQPSSALLTRSIIKNNKISLFSSSSGFYLITIFYSCFSISWLNSGLFTTSGRKDDVLACFCLSHLFHFF